jgi:Fic family protein
MPFQPRFTITNATTAALTKIERARGFVEAAKFSDEGLASMRARAFLLEAHHTTHIEGTHLTLEESERVLAGQTVEGSDPDDVRELLNYRDAFELVASYLGRGDPITEALVREIHRRLVSGVRGNSARPGEYRREQNYVVQSSTGRVIYTPPPPQDVAPMMRELVEWLGVPSDVHPVLVAGIAQFQFVHVHPFVDGNGRTARLLSTLCLYRSGYDFKQLFTLSEFYDRDRPAYYRAIQGVRERGMDLTSWLDYFADGLAVQMTETQQRGEVVLRTDALARKHRLNERQRLALLHVLRGRELTIQSFASLLPETPRRTLQRDLKGMADKGLFLATGATNQLVYRRGPATS